MRYFKDQLFKDFIYNDTADMSSRYQDMPLYCEKIFLEHTMEGSSLSACIQVSLNLSAVIYLCLANISKLLFHHKDMP
jgi:hypothetical protein